VLVVLKRRGYVFHVSTLTLQLPDELKSQLTVAARRAGKTPARLARETLEERFRNAKAPAASKKSLYELGRDLCGSVNGGPTDLASNKKHLRGYGSWKP